MHHWRAAALVDDILAAAYPLVTGRSSETTRGLWLAAAKYLRVALAVWMSLTNHSEMSLGVALLPNLWT